MNTVSVKKLKRKLKSLKLTTLQQPESAFGYLRFKDILSDDTHLISEDEVYLNVAAEAIGEDDDDAVRHALKHSLNSAALVVGTSGNIRKVSPEAVLLQQ